MIAKIKPEVENWIKGLSDEDMPGFASTVTDVTAEIDSDETSAVDVARSVLKDPALTSRLLKMANSFRYHHSSQKINTVSRAIMVLGFEKVRSLTISLVLVDSLQAGQQVIILEEALNEAEEAYSTYPDPDPQLQLTIQQDMAAAFEEKPNINIILEMVLEGLHRGIGMDRALFAILSKDRKQLICKYALGESNEKLSQQFQIDISRDNRLFEQIVDDKKASHVLAESTSTKGNLSNKT